MNRLSYHVKGGNGYYAIDEYINAGQPRYSLRVVEVFKTRKLAESVCGQLNRLADMIHERDKALETIQTNYTCIPKQVVL